MSDYMTIHVNGQGVSIGESLTKYISESLNDLLEKHNLQFAYVSVTISKIHSRMYKTSVVIHDKSGQNIIVRAMNTNFKVMQSVDNVLSKITGILLKNKDKITKHKGLYKGGLKASKYKLSDFFAGHHENTEHMLTEEYNQYIPEDEHIPKCSLETAILLMDLEDKVAFMFINADNNHIVMLHYSKDHRLIVTDTQHAIPS
ncbi:MAG: ribosomal subunit interface protein [Candidatus Xenolissoclinum pacificiensis L6]|uniref:Ribosomal subunit interface protein n=1 Tax=Candidatus Xenolissoclinum pacificiensis L6 TaxID=1401685 RepID=W2V1S8_9RICK|nr:MAG: ribosomal subunit interface protein [Candidatus Xenolissoclinum pacificiensis L6]